MRTTVAIEKKGKAVLESLIEHRSKIFCNSILNFEIHDGTNKNEDDDFEALDFCQVVKLRAVHLDSIPNKFKSILSEAVNLTLQLNAWFQQNLALVVIRTSMNERSVPEGYLLREIFLTMNEENTASHTNVACEKDRSELIVKAPSYGLLRVNFANLPPTVATDVLTHHVPFGQSLEQHKIERQVRVDKLWQINLPSSFFDLNQQICETGTTPTTANINDAQATPGPVQQSLTYGRTVQIYHCNTLIADVLEILNPSCFQS